uniref:Uncharacterized protein n=1 Tax=Glossina austeni TaxID=7395 RepID=A0A1A9VL50_GLOAU
MFRFTSERFGLGRGLEAFVIEEVRLKFMYYSTSTSSSKHCLGNFLRLRLSPVSVFFVPIHFALLWAFLNLVFLKGSSRMRAAPLISSSAADKSKSLNDKSSSDVSGSVYEYSALEYKKYVEVVYFDEKQSSNKIVFPEFCNSLDWFYNPCTILLHLVLSAFISDQLLWSRITNNRSKTVFEWQTLMSIN